MMDLKKLTMELADCDGVSGNEGNAAETAKKFLEPFVDECFIKNGNVIGRIGSGEKRLLIDAHIDQIGFVVTGITDDGFIKIGNVGGIDRRLLLAQQVVIHGKKAVDGVICSIPPHLEKDDPAVPKTDNIYIDTGYDGAGLREIVSLGDFISFAGHSQELLGTRITGHSLDDRCGVASLIYAAELLDKQIPNDISLYFMFSVQEEIGERGAKVGGFDIDPDIAVEVDVSFALTSDESPDKCGKLGKGPMIGISPSLSRRLSKDLMRIAAEKDIPYQTEVMSRLTGTNADQFSVTRGGCEAVTVSIPLRYMHTPVEVIDIRDVEYTGRLLAEFVKEAVCNG